MWGGGGSIFKGSTFTFDMEILLFNDVTDKLFVGVTKELFVDVTKEHFAVVTK